MRALALAVAVTTLAGLATHAAATGRRVATVPCSDVIGQAKTGRDGGYRIVLGVVSVPPARLTQVARTGERRWPYWRKAGLVVRAGTVPVVVSVTNAWRSRAAIVWGGSGRVPALRIAACPTPSDVWNAYAGGFLIRTRRQCVPLTFKVGERSQTVRFGAGGACC